MLDLKLSLLQSAAMSCCYVIQATNLQASVCRHQVQTKLFCYNLGLSRQLESSHSSAHAAIVSTCRADMNTHLDAARQEHQQQLQVLQKQLEKVSEDKADMRLLTQYTQQV